MTGSSLVQVFLRVYVYSPRDMALDEKFTGLKWKPLEP